jgi:hypothetical protein
MTDTIDYQQFFLFYVQYITAETIQKFIEAMLIG